MLKPHKKKLRFPKSLLSAYLSRDRAIEIELFHHYEEGHVLTKAQETQNYWLLRS